MKEKAFILIWERSFKTGEQEPLTAMAIRPPYTSAQANGDGPHLMRRKVSLACEGI